MVALLAGPPAVGTFTTEKIIIYGKFNKDEHELR
jgi:hypothetical protein